MEKDIECSYCNAFLKRSKEPYSLIDGYGECLFTPRKTQSIPECVCHKCLLKTICSDRGNCDIFILNVIEKFSGRKENSMVYNEYLLSLKDRLKIKLISNYVKPEQRRFFYGKKY